MNNQDGPMNASRRRLLGQGLWLGAGAFLFDPFRAVTEGIADGLIERAMAEETGTVGSRNYLNILMPGAPIRYQFDQWLRLNANDPDLAPVASTHALNPMTCNSFDFDSKGNAIPKMTTFAYRGFLVPHLFSQSVATSRATARPLSDLLNNMLVIRGFGSGLDGHQFNGLVQQAPIAGVVTIPGLVADANRKTFDSVQWPDRGGYSTFTSAAGKSQSKVSGSTPLASLMEGFTAPSTKAVGNLKSTYKEAMDLAQARLKSYARSDNAGAKNLAQNLENATGMMAKGVSDIAGYWAPAVARYKGILDAALRASNVPSINQRALVSDESLSWSVGSGDILKLSKDTDARTILASASLQNYAEGLAMAEYLLTQNYSSSLEIRCDGIMNLMLRSAGAAAAVAKNFALDMHATGACSTILIMNGYYRAVAAGLLELVDQLGADLWSRTVVQLQGDFARSARSAGSGSDHGFNQMVTSAFSGAFTNGPVVVGNIQRNGSNANYDGTQGLGAPIDGYTQKGVPTPAMAASTVTALLGTPTNPFANTAPPLVELSQGKLTAVSAPRIIG